MTDVYSLTDAIRDGITLSPEQQRELLHLLGSCCHQKTKDRLARRLALPLSLWSSYGIFSRVYLRYHREGVHYCAGQDYRAEIRIVRECVLGQ